MSKQPPVRKIRVLAIEDDAKRLALLKEYFQHERLIVVAATSAQAAIRTVKNERFDLILLDHDLAQNNPLGAEGAEMSGTNVASALAASQVNRRTPVKVHSMNPNKRQRMHDVLAANHFDVAIVPMDTWTRAMAQEIVEELLADLE